MGINGERLKELRLSKGMNPSDMANLLGISRPAYLKYENGQTKTPRKIEELAKYFNVSTDYLFGNDTPASASPSTSPHSKRDLNDLAKFLNKTEVMFDGDTYNLSEEDQQKLRNALEFVFWDAKRQNKRKKD